MPALTPSSLGPSYQSHVSRPVRPVGRGLIPSAGRVMSRSAAAQMSPIVGTGGSSGSAGVPSGSSGMQRGSFDTTAPERSRMTSAYHCPATPNPAAHALPDGTGGGGSGTHV